MSKLEVLPKRIEILDVNDPTCSFRINIDVLNEAFGLNKSYYARAGYPQKKGEWIKAVNSNDNFFIWMGNLCDNSAEWVNRLSADGKILYESCENPRKIDWIDEIECAITDNAIRLAFVRNSKKEPFKFVGVFENEDMSHLKHSYRRIATKVKLHGNPVYAIELLDDIRKK